MFSPFYLASFAWNLAHGMTNVLVPLYALHLGMSGMGIGSLVALPVILQFVFNLLGGVLVDRLGSKNVLYLACCASLLASVTYSFSTGFAGLFLGQCLFVLSRASFWPANYSLGTQLPGDRSRNMGRLNSLTNGGQIIGTGLAGMVIASAGYRLGFLTIALAGIAAIACNFFTVYLRPPRTRPHRGILDTYRALAKQRSMYFAMACAFLSVLPFVLSASFHPMLLVSEGYGAQTIGWLLTLRAIGAIFAGIALARLARAVSNRSVPFWCCFFIGASLAASALFPDWWSMTVWLFVLGVASGLIAIYFQILISVTSPDEERGSAMSYGGIGWNLSNLIPPLVMGMLTDWLNVYYAFYFAGAIIMACAFMLLPLYRWAFPSGKPA
jgi:MFS family permease